MHCGNSPVNHFGQCLSQSFGVWSSGTAGSEEGLRRKLTEWMDALFFRIEPVIYACVAALPVTHFAHDPGRANTYRSQVVWEEAQRRGISMEQLTVFGKGTEIYRARKTGGWRYFQSLPVSSSLSRESCDWMDDKYLLKRALAKAGIPSPRAVSVTTEHDALKEFESGTAAPNRGSRGRHHCQRSGSATRSFRVAKALPVRRYRGIIACVANGRRGKLRVFRHIRPV